jgi:lantibiotic biosynthesis protein
VARRPFAPQSGTGTLARIPLLPACPRDRSSPSADLLLAEGIFLASRQADAATARAGHQADPGRLAATLRGYEIRARSRPTPHGVFAGVTLAWFAAKAARLQLGSDHRARTSMRAGWLAAVCAQVLADPGVLPVLTFTTNNLVTYRGQRFEHE